MADLRSYVRKALDKGHSEKVIREYLQKKGYSAAVISQGFNNAKRPDLPRFNTRTIEIVGAVVIIGIIVIALLLTGTANECNDDLCFIQNAQECKDTTYIKEEGTTGSLVLYEINGCTLEKSIYTFAPEEPVEIVQLFGDRVMTCSYTKNGFDEEWISSLVAGIDSCSGDLRDAIFELKLAQYELLG